MRQRPARLLPVARRGRDPDPETAPRGALGSGAGQDAAVRRPRPHHRLRRQHAAARLHQRNPDQPNLEQGFYPGAGEQGLTVIATRWPPRNEVFEPTPLVMTSVVPAKAGTD